MPSAKINVNLKQESQQRPNNSQQEKKQKIIIVGDSHTQVSASNIKYNLSDDFDIGFLKPGVDITSLTSSVTEETKSLTFKDILVFWGGTNDVSRNDSQEGLRKLIKFVEVNSNTNIILLCVPHHHDLPSSSCVNNKIATFNRKLNKLMKSYKHVKVLKTGLDRNLFTRRDAYEQPGQRKNSTRNGK